MMKKFVLGLVAASIAATPAMAAAPQNYHGKQVQTVVKHKANGRTVVKQKVVKRAPVQYRSWHRGERFDSRYARNYRQVDYRQYRGLKAPPRGYHYVQSGNDVVLVSILGGLVGAVFANLIN